MPVETSPGHGGLEIIPQVCCTILCCFLAALATQKKKMYSYKERASFLIFKKAWVSAYALTEVRRTSVAVRERDGTAEPWPDVSLEACFVLSGAAWWAPPRTSGSLCQPRFSTWKMGRSTRTVDVAKRGKRVHKARALCQQWHAGPVRNGISSEMVLAIKFLLKIPLEP